MVAWLAQMSAAAHTSSTAARSMCAMPTMVRILPHAVRSRAGEVVGTKSFGARPKKRDRESQGLSRPRGRTWQELCAPWANFGFLRAAAPRGLKPYV